MDLQTIKKKLENNLKIPIHEILLDTEIIHIKTVKNNVLFSLSLEDNNTDLQVHEGLLNGNNWYTLIKDYKDIITNHIENNLNIKGFKMYPIEPYTIEIKSISEQSICFMNVQFFNSDWVISIKENTNVLRLQQQITDLKNAEQEATSDPQTILVSKGIEIVGKIYESYLQRQIESKKQHLELNSSFEKEELTTVNNLDKRDKIYKGIMLFICISALSILAVYDKASSVAPVIGVVIGLVLQNNIITDYFTGSGKKKKIKSNLDYD